MQNNNYLPITQEENPEIWQPENISWEPKIGDKVKYNVCDGEGGFYCSCGINMRSHVVNKKGYGVIVNIDPPTLIIHNYCKEVTPVGQYKY